MRMTPLLSAATLAVVLASPAAHSSVVISKDFNTTTHVNAVSAVKTTGSDMAGLKVTATFSNGLQQTLSWAAATTASKGGVTGSNWGLSVSGDTYTNDWAFTMGADLGSLRSLRFDSTGTHQFTVFDTSVPSPGTQGSSTGLDFDFAEGCADCNALVTYYNAVGLHKDSPLGDVFGGMVIDFGTAGPMGRFSFSQDTDTAIDVLDTNGGTVPEPSSLALIGAAILALSVKARRRNS